MRDILSRPASGNTNALKKEAEPVHRQQRMSRTNRCYLADLPSKVDLSVSAGAIAIRGITYEEPGLKTELGRDQPCFR